MVNHTCARCGFEVSCSHGRWHDRHPIAAVLLALPAGYTLTGVILAYPWFFVPLLVVLAALWVDRRNRQRAAIAARADWEHRERMAQAIFGPHPLLPASVSPRRRPSPPRGADHWSTTRPLRRAG